MLSCAICDRILTKKSAGSLAFSRDRLLLYRKVKSELKQKNIDLVLVDVVPLSLRSDSIPVTTEDKTD